MGNVKAIPDGYHTVTPYLFIGGAAKAVEFYKKAFGATEIMRLDGADGKIMHAEIQIGDSRIMMTDECPDMKAVGPKTLGGTSSQIYLYVEDVDARFQQAVAAGATVVMPIKDQFYGDRTGAVQDPFGHVWHFATHTEEVSLEEVRKRMAALPKK